MDLQGSTREQADRLMALRLRKAKEEASMASLKADIGDAILALKEDLKKDGVTWRAWRKDDQKRSFLEGVPELSERSIRDCVNMARFRRSHAPAVAERYLRLEPTGLRAVMTLPAGSLAEFLERGVPLRSGTRVPLEMATTRELSEGAAVARAQADPGARPARKPTPAKGAPTPAWHFEQATLHLSRAGTLSEDQVECVIALVLERTAPSEVAATATRRAVLTAILGAVGGDREALAEYVTRTLENLVPMGQEVRAAAGREVKMRARRAIATLLMSVGRWDREAAA